MVKSFIKKIVNKHLIWQSKKISDSFYSNVIRYNPQLREKAVDEEKWLEKWRQFDSCLSPMAFRIFSRYIGPNMDIVPLEICNSICEPVLTPYNFNFFYSDKNSFDILFPQGTLPKTLLRKIRGKWFDSNYAPITHEIINQYINSFENNDIIVKPSRSSSGKGVEKFSRKNNSYINANGEQLTLSFLDKGYPFNCIIQVAFSQHSFFAKFNPTSVNSIRIVTYRDSAGVIHPLNSFLRIGASGSVVDNAHAGGMFIGVDSGGKLGKYVCDQFGRTSQVFNNIDFSKESFVVPNWKTINNKVIELSQYIIHHDLIAWDAVLDVDGIPHILEVNIGGYGGWAFQFTSGPMFGDYTDDVMKTSLQRMKETELKMMFIRKQ